ncbi:hypothetical protein Tco_0691495 [Tanacetum coccineum]
MSIIRDKTKGTLRLSEEKYIGKVLEKFIMKDAETRCQPLGEQFKLMGVVSRFMSNQGREHWEAVKWLLRYLKCLRRLPFVSAENGCLEGNSPIQTMRLLRFGKLLRAMFSQWGEAGKGRYGEEFSGER